MSFIDGIKLWLAKAAAELLLSFGVLLLLLLLAGFLDPRKSGKEGDR